jgi:hypothetical protein
VRLIAPILEDAESDGNSRKFSIGVTRQGSFHSLRHLALVDGYYARQSPIRDARVETVCNTLHDVCFSGLITRSQLI